MPSLIPVRVRRGGRRHALPETGADRTLCDRPAAGLILDEGSIDCKRCLRVIEVG